MVVMRRLVAGQLWVRLLVALISVSLITGATLALRASQSRAKEGIETRFAARATLSATFVSTYVHQLTNREQLVATNTLSGADPSAAFASDVQAFGFQAGVLLNSAGQALAIEPSAPQLIGQQYGTKYAHLAVALKGTVAVSNVVISAVKSAPVVAFAVPFNTPSGRRVFSGAYIVNETPVAAFLSATTTLKHAVLYLTDGTGTVLASNGALTQEAQSLSQRNRDLGSAAAQSQNGEYTSASVAYTFVKVAVPGTTWSLLISAPSSGVYVSVNGSTHWLPWLILGGLSILMLVAAWLTIRL
ncbi:MAG TPA: cache domain-containing protein, partial [Acidothermaceae bacterium]